MRGRGPIKAGRGWGLNKMKREDGLTGYTDLVASPSAGPAKVHDGKGGVRRRSGDGPWAGPC